MARRRGARRGKRGTRAVLAGVLALALCAGFVGGYLLGRNGPGSSPGAGPRLAAVEALVGTLDPAGVRVRTADAAAAERLLERLRRAASETAGVRLDTVRRGPGYLAAVLEADGTRYPIDLAWSGLPEPAPRLALVIDDMGRDAAVARAFLDLDVPITLSILPHLPHSREVAALCRQAGRPYLLHLPMQPQGYPTIDPGPGAVLVGMGRDQVLATVAADLAQVPGASGVNNHMGSRLTELAEPMGWVVEELASRGLFFLDSLTSARSVAATAAAERGVPWARRDVFLDNERSPEAVGAQLERAVERARRAGAAVAIGHPHAVTLETIRRWLPRIREAGVELVPLDAVLRTGEG